MTTCFMSLRWRMYEQRIISNRHRIKWQKIHWKRKLIYIFLVILIAFPFICYFLICFYQSLTIRIDFIIDFWISISFNGSTPLSDQSSNKKKNKQKYFKFYCFMELSSGTNVKCKQIKTQRHNSRRMSFSSIGYWLRYGWNERYNCVTVHKIIIIIVVLLCIHVITMMRNIFVTKQSKPSKHNIKKIIL